MNLPPLNDVQLAWKDSGGPTPLSRRFGEERRWHPICDFLYETRDDNGEIMWGARLGFRAEECKVLSK